MIPKPKQNARETTKNPRDKRFYLSIARKAIRTKKMQALPVEQRIKFLLGAISIKELDSFVNSLTPGEHDVFFELILLGMKTNGIVVLNLKKLGELASTLSPDKLRKVRGKDAKKHQAYRETLVKGLLNKMKAARFLAVQNRKMVMSQRQTNRYLVAPCFYLPELKDTILKYLYTLRSNTYCSLSFLTSYCYKKLGAKFTESKKRLLYNMCILNRYSLCNYIASMQFLFELFDMLDEEDKKESTPQRETHESSSSNLDNPEELVGKSRELDVEEEAFQMEALKRLQLKARQTLSLA